MVARRALLAPVRKLHPARSRPNHSFYQPRIATNGTQTRAFRSARGGTLRALLPSCSQGTQPCAEHHCATAEASFDSALASSPAGSGGGAHAATLRQGSPGPGWRQCVTVRVFTHCTRTRCSALQDGGGAGAAAAAGAAGLLQACQDRSTEFEGEVLRLQLELDSALGEVEALQEQLRAANEAPSKRLRASTDSAAAARDKLTDLRRRLDHCQAENLELKCKLDEAERRRSAGDSHAAASLRQQEQTQQQQQAQALPAGAAEERGAGGGDAAAAMEPAAAGEAAGEAMQADRLKCCAMFQPARSCNV